MSRITRRIDTKPPFMEALAEKAKPKIEAAKQKFTFAINPKLKAFIVTSFIVIVGGGILVYVPHLIGGLFPPPTDTLHPIAAALLMWFLGLLVSILGAITIGFALWCIYAIFIELIAPLYRDILSHFSPEPEKPKYKMREGNWK